MKDLSLCKKHSSVI